MKKFHAHEQIQLPSKYSDYPNPLISNNCTAFTKQLGKNYFKRKTQFIPNVAALFYFNIDPAPLQKFVFI